MPDTDAELKIGFNLDKALEDIGSLKNALADAFKKIDGKGFTKLEGRISATTKDVENLDERLSSASANVTNLSDKLKELDIEKQVTLGKIADEERGLRALQKTWNEKYERAPGSNGATKNLEAQAAQNRLIKENKEYIVLIEQEQAKLQAEYDKATASANEVLTAYTQQKDAVSQIVADVETSVQEQREFSRETKDTSGNAETLRENLDGAATASQSFAQSVKDMAATSTDNPLNSLPQETDEATTKLTELENTLNNVVATTDRISEAMNTEPATNNIAELIRRLNELNVAKKTLESLNLPAGTDATYNKIIQLIAVLNGQVSDYKRQLTGVAAEHEKTKKSGTDFTKFVTAGVKSLKSAMSNLAKTSSKVKSSFDGIARSMRSNFKHMITSITKYVLGFRSLFFLVRRLRKYLGEGIQNLARFNDGNNIVNESITDMLSSLLFLKNAWAAAFSPIITYVRPILVSLIDSLAEVGNAVARFVGAILGQEVVFNAVRVKAQDYADSLDNVGGSASGAADKAKKLTDRLAAFDDLNVLGVDNDPDGTGSGGGGGIADQYIPDPNEMFTIVDPERNGFLEMLKKAWEDADFSVVGATIKDKIIAQLQGIDWDSVQGTGTKIGSSLGSFIAGLFGDPELFKAAGTTIGETLNTITYTVQAFLDWADGIDFGGNLAEGFNTFLDVTDWQTAGDNINRVITGIVDNVDSFITTLDADKVVTAIKDFMTGLKIKEIVASVIDLALDVTNLVLTVTGGLVWEWGQSFGDFLINWVKEDMPSAYTDENGIKVPISIDMTPTFDYDEHPLAALLERIQTGLGKAILNKVLNVDDLSPDELADLTDSWNRIIDKLFKAVVDTFTLGTGTGGIITSLLNPPKDEEGNTDWEQIGYDIADGIWIGMGKSLKKIGDNQWIRENIYDPFWEAVSNIFDMHSPSKVTEEWGGWIGEGLLNGISNLIPDVEQIFIDLKDWLSGKWDEIKGNTYEKWVGIKTNVLTKADEIKDSAEEKFDTLKTNLTNKWQEIKGAIYEKLVGIKLNMKEVFEQMGEAIKAPINTIIDIIEGMVNKCIDGINSLTSGLRALTDLGSEIANKIGMPSIPHIGQLSHITIPHLAQGAVIPPNREFMAVLGDQSHGTNIEAPLDTIKQAVAEVLANNGNAEMIQLLQQLITVVENKNLVIGDKDIGRANARYVKQQNIVRGSTF